mmetsp:Transcript_19540/g.58586  ORF Transcript_19540/g.58586 Transcript_19540/m.58586 type:complete len:778 (-) Transcript_19540:3-2336(-)
MSAMSPRSTGGAFEGPGASHVEQALQAAITQLDPKAKHTDPKPWAEVWLTFPDRTGNCLGLGGGLDGERGSALTGQEESWKEGALRHLRELLVQGSGAGIALGGGQKREGGELGPDLGEHLQFVTHAMERVTHAVTVLQAPEQYTRPLVLKEYTGGLIDDVCKDLRQWLQKICDALPLYHVHLLESETERRRLLELCERLMRELEAERVGHKQDTMRADETKRMIEELKMKQRAQALLGVADDDDDALIFSRNDVKRMKDEWEEELLREFEVKRLQPLLDEIAKLRLQREEAMDRLTVQSVKPVVPPEKPGTHQGILDSLKMLTERCAQFSPTQKAILALEQAAKDPDSADFAEVTEKIQRLPELGAVPRAASPPKPGPLVAVGKELGVLEAELRNCPVESGAERLLPLISWASGALPAGTSEPPPAWDVDFLKGSGRPAGRAFGVNTDDNFFPAKPKEDSGASKKPPPPAAPDNGIDKEALMKKLREEMEAKYRDQMNRMKADFERQLQAERDAAAAERAKFEALIAELQADLEAANKLAKDLRKKLLDLQRMMKAKGMGAAFEDALQNSGMNEYLLAGGVFERLYNDALARMRRWQEAYMGRLDQIALPENHLYNKMEIVFRRTPPIITGFSALKQGLDDHTAFKEPVAAAHNVTSLPLKPGHPVKPGRAKVSPRKREDIVVKQHRVSNLLPPLVKALVPDDPSPSSLSIGFAQSPGHRAGESDRESDVSPGGKGGRMVDSSPAMRRSKGSTSMPDLGPTLQVGAAPGSMATLLR